MDLLFLPVVVCSTLGGNVDDCGGEDGDSMGGIEGCNIGVDDEVTVVNVTSETTVLWLKKWLGVVDFNILSIDIIKQ